MLVFSKSLDQHFQHINIFVSIIKRNGLAISKTKINLFQTKIIFLGQNIHQGTQLQRFLGCLNYVFDFIPQLSNIIKPLHDRLKKDPPPWTYVYTNIVKIITGQVNDVKLLKLLKLMLLILDMGAFLNKKSLAKNKLLLILPNIGILHNKNILQLKKKF